MNKEKVVENSVHACKSKPIKARSSSKIFKPTNLSKEERRQIIMEKKIEEGKLRKLRRVPKNDRIWEERFQELKVYKEKHGDINIPVHYKENKPLGRWIDKQRQNYRSNLKGLTTSLTSERTLALDQLGFVFQHRAPFLVPPDTAPSENSMHACESKPIKARSSSKIFKPTNLSKEERRQIIMKKFMSWKPKPQNLQKLLHS